MDLSAQMRIHWKISSFQHDIQAEHNVGMLLKYFTGKRGKRGNLRERLSGY